MHWFLVQNYIFLNLGFSAKKCGFLFALVGFFLPCWPMRAVFNVVATEVLMTTVAPPNPSHPNPVALVHGMISNAWINFFTIGPGLANQGYCAFESLMAKGEISLSSAVWLQWKILPSNSVISLTMS